MFVDRKDFAIGVLSTTAVVLLVGLLLLESRPTPALGGEVSVARGGYIMTIGGMAIISEQLVYVIDTTSERMVTYRFDPARRAIRQVQGFDLAGLRRAGRQPQGQPQVFREYGP